MAVHNAKMEQMLLCYRGGSLRREERGGNVRLPDRDPRERRSKKKA